MYLRTAVSPAAAVRGLGVAARGYVPRTFMRRQNQPEKCAIGKKKAPVFFLNATTHIDCSAAYTAVVPSSLPPSPGGTCPTLADDS